ncbi:MAG: antibiotic biosynthesis monooxygenase [Desulfobacterales bacterium]
MAVRIFIRRHVKEGLVEETIQMLSEFRKSAMDQPGYLSGETLANHYDAKSVTVISTWQSVEDWIQWQESEERASNEVQIENLLDRPTLYEVYDIVSSSR